MWALALLALIVLLFVSGIVIALGWFLASPKPKRPRIITVVALPFGCAAIPLVGLIAAVLLAPLFQKSDLQLYQEIFGEGTTVPEQSMLFDEFGRGRTREIYMRIYPNGAERDYLLSLPNSKPSDATLEQFIARGDQHGFTWWISSDPHSAGYCQSARILEIDGFRGWEQLRIAECLDAGEDFPASANYGQIHVIAWHRRE
jgi:hypothetical protein